MDPSPLAIETLLTSEMTREEALAIGELIVRVWPKPGVTAEDRANVLQTNRGDSNPPAELESRSLVIRDGTRVVGHALIFPRTIGTSLGDMTIAALGSVCTDPSYRGQRMGERLVHEAWRAVDDGRLPFSLFQTSEVVSQFYTRLGATVVENTFINSLADDPTKSPFKDQRIMRYPATREGWPSGTIDLRGPGY
jgi:GNAT superfamily N-acetyltransferase